jgi:hypothetical protein
MNMHNRVKQEGLVTGVAKTIEDTGERAPIGGTASRFLHDISSSESFWRDVTPARKFSEKATSIVVENAMLLPLFSGITKAADLGIGLVGRAAEGTPYLTNLTKVLNATPTGKIAAKMMTYGTEGLAFGALTTDATDKKDSWKMALRFAAMGTMFSVLGKGTSKLVDMLPEGEEKAAMTAAEEEAELGAKGKQAATREEVLDQYQTHMASVMAAGGMATAHSVVEEALAHIAMEEKAPIDTMERLHWWQDLNDNDPVHWQTVRANMRVIQTYLDVHDLKLTKLDDDQAKGLVEFIHNQLDKAASEIDTRVPEVAAMKAKELSQNPQVGSTAVQKATEAKSIEGPSNVASTAAAKIPNPSIETAHRRVESRYEYTKGKITGYQMGISFDWNVAKENMAKAKGGKNTPGFWRDYVDTLVGHTDDWDAATRDFAHDLREYFNPTKEYGLQFEKSGAGGGDYTNFLAYMYGFRSKLPRPVANQLEKFLMNSPKMGDLLGSRPTEEKLAEFSQAIHNHIDLFTRSEWYQEKGQRNVFRSSQPGIKGEDSLSKWQRDLKLMESAHKKDIARGKEFYPGRSKAMIEARARYESTLRLMQEKEKAAYIAGKPRMVAKLLAKSREYVAAEGVQ